MDPMGNGKSQSKMDDKWGSPIFGNLHMITPSTRGIFIGTVGTIHQQTKKDG